MAFKPRLADLEKGGGIVAAGIVDRDGERREGLSLRHKPLGIFRDGPIPYGHRHIGTDGL